MQAVITRNNSILHPAMPIELARQVLFDIAAVKGVKEIYTYAFTTHKGITYRVEPVE